MHTRWLLCFIVHFALCTLPLRAEDGNQSLDNVPLLNEQRIVAHINAYRQQLFSLRVSKYLVIGSCGVAAGTYLLAHIASLFYSSDRRSFHPVPPPTPQDIEKLDVRFKTEQLKVWKEERERREYRNSFKGRFIQTFRWALMTSFALTCAHLITQSTGSLGTSIKKKIYQWWRADATTYYHDTYESITKQARCIMQLLKLLQGDAGESLVTGVNQRALLHRKELLVFYSFFLRTVEKIVALMLIMEKEELSFHIHQVVQNMHNASSALAHYMHDTHDPQALSLFLLSFDAVMFALQGVSQLMVFS